VLLKFVSWDDQPFVFILRGNDIAGFDELWNTLMGELRNITGHATTKN
jgi:hypothetical protein